jgi:hypothetical protein
MYTNDIAILHLSRRLYVDNDIFISRICKSSTYNLSMDITEYPRNGTRLVISGWDFTNMSSFPRSIILQQAEVYAMDGNNTTCFVSDDRRQIQCCAGRYGSDKGNILIFRMLLTIFFCFIFF